MICTSVNRFFIVQFPLKGYWTPDRHVAISGRQRSMAPVAQGVHIAHVQAVFQALRNIGHATGYFAGGLGNLKQSL
jgi:hypothetical protein